MDIDDPEAPRRSDSGRGATGNRRLPPATTRRRGAAVGVVLVVTLVIATLAVYAPVLGNGFVNYDDGPYLLENPRVRGGFTLEGFVWAFSITEHPNWHPLTWISHMLDFQFFGGRAGHHHAVSAIMHAGNAALLFALLRNVTGTIWPSAFVAALFALHPLRVESVAWASERKDVLSALFGFLALAAYLRFVRRHSAGAYAAALALFACALMAKSMLVTFPALLLLLDFWPLGRWRSVGRGPLLPDRRLLAEKAPFLALALTAGVIAVIAQRAAGTVAALTDYPLGERIGNAFRSYGGYLWKTVWPAKLAVFYPNFWQDVPWWQPVLGATLVVTVTVAVCLAMRRLPAAFVGWVWYVVALLPVIGILQVGSQSLADRYTYLPQIGLLIAIAWSLAGLFARHPRMRIAAGGVAVAVLAAAAVASGVQVTVWRSSETLFSHAARVTGRNYIAHANLGNALVDSGRFSEAIAQFNEALRIKPNYEDAHFNLANTLARVGRVPEAMVHFQCAVAARPDFPEARNNLGLMLLSQGRHDEALVQFQSALRSHPDDPRARRNLERALNARRQH